MKTCLYTVHLLDSSRDNGLVFVKDGFSWPAFFVSVPWALFHRMWRVAAILAVVQTVASVVMVLAGLNEWQQAAASLTLAAAIGYGADELRRAALSRRGYAFVDVVVEKNLDQATRRYLDASPALAARLLAAAS